MKRLLAIIILSFILFGFTLTNKNHKNFVGQWVWKNNNQTFIVTITSTFNLLKGDYLLKETINNKETIIYKSDKIIDANFNLNFGNAIAGNSKNGSVFKGIVKDNVLLGDGIHTIKEGELTLKVISSKKISWKIKELIALDKKRKTVPKNFSIPTDIILTKLKKK